MGRQRQIGAIFTLNQILDLATVEPMTDAEVRQHIFKRIGIPSEAARVAIHRAASYFVIVMSLIKISVSSR